MTADILSPLLVGAGPELLTLSGGAIAGLAVGYFLKIAFKIVALVGGAIIVLLGFLEYYGIISISYPKLETAIQGTAVFMYNQTSAVVGHLNKNFSNTDNGSHVVTGGIGFMGGFWLSRKI